MILFQGIYPYEGLCFWGVVSICGGVNTWEGANACEGMYTSESCEVRECTSVEGIDDYLCEDDYC